MAQECKTSGITNYSTAAKIANENILMASRFLSFIQEYIYILECCSRPSFYSSVTILKSVFDSYCSKLTRVTVSGVVQLARGYCRNMLLNDDGQ